MKKLIASFSFCVMMMTPAFALDEGALLFSPGSAQFDAPIVFVHNAGVLKSDFQDFQQVQSWEKVDSVFVVITLNFMTAKLDTFKCRLIPMNHGDCVVNKKDPKTYFNGVYYNKKTNRFFLMNYPAWNALHVYNSDMSGGMTISPITYHDSSSQNGPHFSLPVVFEILCYNRISPEPFSNVFELLDSVNQPMSQGTQWVCAHKVFVDPTFLLINPSFKSGGVENVRLSFFSGAVHFNMDKAGTISLKLVDLRGREVATLSNGNKNAGKYSIPLKGLNISRGNYLCILETKCEKSAMKINIM